MRMNKHVGKARHDTACEIEGEEPLVTQKVFHIVPENPQKPHVKDYM
jgi:hypothetical protein